MKINQRLVATTSIASLMESSSVAAPDTGTRSRDSNLYAGWSVSGADWDAHVASGYSVQFFSDSAMHTPVYFNAVSVLTDDWGTCCTQDNDTPTGSAPGSAIYHQFETSAASEPVLGY